VSVNRLIALCTLLIASAWVALINGQPLFHPDSTAYLRGPDFAVVYFLGNKFSTSWTQQRTLEGDQNSTRHETGEPAVQGSTLNSPFDKIVLSGRSIYYGALLYLGHLTSSLWLSVFAQSAIFVYLSYTLVVTCLRFSVFTLLCLDLTVLAVTPLSFFVSNLMPDVFASFLILATIILLAFWNSIRLRERIVVSAILLYSALTHTSHLLLLLCLVIAFCIVFIVKHRALLRGLFSVQGVVLIAVVLGAVLGEQAFLYGARLTIGADPIRPPFVMARLIADGPGYQFLKQNCATKTYVVCRYVDRFPITAPAFLWSTDPMKGVFSVADAATRSALSSEQTSFALDVMRFDPIGLIVNAGGNTIREYFSVGIDQFFLNQEQLQWAKGKLPTSYFEKLLHTHIVLNDWMHNWIRTPVTIWYLSVYILSSLCLVLALAFWPIIQSRTKSSNFPQQQWFYALSIAITAIVFNAAICGVFSEPLQRYQTRISWIPSFLLLLLMANLWEVYSPVKDKPELARRMVGRLPRPLRFLGIGGIGLFADLTAFTIIVAFGVHPLIARLGSLAVATFVTWRLNRELTFDRSGRRRREEAMRYATVTVVAQGTSYAIFAALALTVFTALPQAAILIGAAIGALLSYNGHRLLSFAPKAIHSHS
jgi:putative flippase GtrA